MITQINWRAVGAEPLIFRVCRVDTEQRTKIAFVFFKWDFLKCKLGFTCSAWPTLYLCLKSHMESASSHSALRALGSDSQTQCCSPLCAALSSGSPWVPFPWRHWAMTVLEAEPLNLHSVPLLLSSPDMTQIPHHRHIQMFLQSRYHTLGWLKLVHTSL